MPRIRVRRLLPLAASLLLLVWYGFLDKWDLKLANFVRHHKISTPMPTLSDLNLGTTAIPRLILRTFKTENRLEILAGPMGHYFRSWESVNPNHLSLVFDDDNLSRFVRGTFAARVANAYFKLPRIVQRSDFGRYLMLYEFGGVYADMDTENWFPIDLWTRNVPGRNISAIIGVEMHGCHHNLDSKLNTNGVDQFTQWTMALVPRHALLENLILSITDAVERSDQKYLEDVENVVALTGPAAWSYAWWEYFHARGFDVRGMQGLDRGFNVYDKVGDVDSDGATLILGRTYFALPGIFSRHRYAGEQKGGWKGVGNTKTKLLPPASEKEADDDTPARSVLKPNNEGIPRRILAVTTNSRNAFDNCGGSWHPIHARMSFTLGDVDRLVRGRNHKPTSPSSLSRIRNAYFSYSSQEQKAILGSFLVLHDFGGIVLITSSDACVLDVDEVLSTVDDGKTGVFDGISGLLAVASSRGNSVVLDWIYQLADAIMSDANVDALVLLGQILSKKK